MKIFIFIIIWLRLVLNIRLGGSEYGQFVYCVLCLYARRRVIVDWQKYFIKQQKKKIKNRSSEIRSRTKRASQLFTAGKLKKKKYVREILIVISNRLNSVLPIGFFFSSVNSFLLLVQLFSMLFDKLLLVFFFLKIFCSVITCEFWSRYLGAV